LHGSNAKVAVIGPAGERLSLISGVCNDRGRIAARSGLGAVMGSKRIKAVVLDSRKRIEVSDKSQMKSLTDKSLKFINLKMPLPGGWFLPLVGSMMRVMPPQMMKDGFK